MAETKTAPKQPIAAAVAKPKQKPKAAPAPKQPIVRPHGFALIGPFDETAEPDPVQAAMDAAVADHNAGVQKRQAEALARTLRKANQRGEPDPVQAAMDAAVAEHSAAVAQANAEAAGAVDEARLAALKDSILEEARRDAAAAIADALKAAGIHDKVVAKALAKAAG